MVDCFDIYHNGHIRFEDYCIMMGPRRQGKASGLSPGEMREVFNALDMNNMGNIAPVELKVQALTHTLPDSILGLKPK